MSEVPLYRSEAHRPLTPWTLDSQPHTLMMSGLDGSDAVHTVLPWEAFGGHVPPGGSEMYWFDQSNPIHLLPTTYPKFYN